MVKKDISWLLNTPIAHRGLFDENYPENTEPAFEQAIKLGYGIELDVQMTIDNVLVVYHDDNLLRVCGIDKDIREITYEELKSLRPNGKQYPIMTFKEFLSFVDGKAPLLIEVKHQKRKGIEELLVKELDEYKGLFAVQSFNPNIVKRVSVLRPNFIVGVLCTREPSKIAPKIVSKLMNVFAFKLYVPFNFLSVRVKDLPINYKMIKKYNIIAWTIKTEEDLKIAEKYAKNIIFEKTVPTLSKFGDKNF
jgi:glycerophosphoryl diester phosphodiesterase